MQLLRDDAYITVADGVHGQQVVAMVKLEVDDLQRRLDLRNLPELFWSTLPHHVLQQQAVLTDALHGLQQVGPQVHLVLQLQLLLLKQQQKKNGALMSGGGESLRFVLERCLGKVNKLVFLQKRKGLQVHTLVFCFFSSNAV